MTVVIGVTGRRSRAAFDFPGHLAHLESDLHVVDYGESIAAAGGVPVLLTRDADPVALAARLDGVVIAGGEDVDPRRYGSAPGPRMTLLDPGRDEFEIALVLAALDAGLPVLGICRGAQVINVALGGTLVADLPADEGEGHSFLGYPPAHRSHAVRIAPGSTLAELYGPLAHVNSYHHQAVAEPGDGLVVTARAPDDVIEAVELPGADLLGVQWHPELLSKPDPVFRWLVERATNRLSPFEEEFADAIA